MKMARKGIKKKDKKQKIKKIRWTFEETFQT
jgi:hypothetical protein